VDEALDPRRSEGDDAIRRNDNDSHLHQAQERRLGSASDGRPPKAGGVRDRDKDGSTRTERVGRILWQGDGIALATIARGGGERPCSDCGGLTSEECSRCGIPLHRRCSDSIFGPPLCQGCAD
jgi:hypothetical protein